MQNDRSQYQVFYFEKFPDALFSVRIRLPVSTRCVVVNCCVDLRHPTKILVICLLLEGDRSRTASVYFGLYTFRNNNSKLLFLISKRTCYHNNPTEVVVPFELVD